MSCESFQTMLSDELQGHLKVNFNYVYASLKTMNLDVNVENLFC